MHEYDLIIAPLIALLCVAIGLVIYFNDRNNSSGRVAAVMSSAIGGWVMFAFLSDIVKDHFLSLILNRLIFVSLIIFMSSMLYLPFVFPLRSKYAKLVKNIASIFSILLVTFTLFTPFVISNIQFESWGSNIIYGNYFIVFIVFTIISILVLITKFIISYIRLGAPERSKIRLFFAGLIIVTVVNIFVQVIIRNIVGSDEFYRFGNYSVIIFVAFTAYAIVRQQLFDVKLILTEIGVAIVNIAAIEQIFLSQGTYHVLINSLLFVFVAYGSYILVKSVIREIKFREELQVMSEQLARANSHLKDLDKMKTEFVSLASHELLTPVSAIEGYLSMILDEHLAKVDDPKAAQYLDRIYRSSKRLARLIADMLNISRIEEGRLLVEKKDVNLSELVSQVIEEVKFKAEEKKQKVVFESSNVKLQMSNEGQNPNDKNAISGKPSAVSQFMTYADPDKIKEVIINLVGNSIKYSKNPGTITINIEKVPTAKINQTWGKIETDVKEGPLDDQEAIHAAVDDHFREILGDEQLLISVKDEGIGIPKDELPKLFKKFHRVGDYTTAESQGTGLGLYISRALVELHHGRIWPTSEGPGKGSKFYFSLPTIETKEEIVGIEKQVQQDKEQLKPLAKPMSEKKGDI